MAEAGSQFLGLTAAAKRLGVHPATLRRWADQGDVLCVITPGGHRRFPRTEIDSLLRQRDGSSEAGENLIETLLQSTRSEIAQMQSSSWMTGISEAQRQHLRVEGRHVMELLREYLSEGADRKAILESVREAGADYAASAQTANMRLTELLEAVSFFRSHILETALDQKNVSSEERRATFRDVNGFLNTLLLSVADTFESAH